MTSPAPTETQRRGGRSRRQEQQPDRPSSAVLVIAKPKDALERIDHYLTERQPRLDAMLAFRPGAAAQLRSIAMHALAHPRLLEKLPRTDLVTAIQAVDDCAALGLMPIAALAQAYFVPYWNRDKGLFDIVLIPGYRGLSKLVVDGQRVMNLEAHVVYANDTLLESYGSENFVTFVPFRGGDRGAWGGAVSFAAIPNPVNGNREIFPHVIDEAQVAKARASSRAGDKGPWVDYPGPMRQKTVIRDHSKFLPLTPLAERGLALEAEAEERHTLPPANALTAKSFAIPAFESVREGLGLSTPRAEGEEASGAAVESRADEASDIVDGEVREVPTSSTSTAGARGSSSPRASAGPLASSHPDAEPPDEYSGDQPPLFEGD